MSFFGEIEGIFDPGGNPEAIHGAASACRELAADLDQIVASLDGAATKLENYWKGIPGPNGEDESAAAKYQTAWGGFRTAIQDYAQNLGPAAKQLDSTADVIQQHDEQARRLWEMMIAAVAIGTAMAIFTFGGSEAAADAEVAADTAEAGVLAAETAESLSAAQVFFAQLGTTLANLAGRFVLGAGTAFVQDVIEKALKGENPFDPANWSANDLTGIILSGTVAMVLGPFTMRNFTVNPLLSKLSPELADFVTGSARNINTILRESPILGNAGYFAATSLASSSVDEFWVDGKSLDDPSAWEAVAASTGLAAVGGAAFGGAVQGFRWLSGTTGDGPAAPGDGPAGTTELTGLPDTPEPPVPPAPEPPAGAGDGGGAGTGTTGQEVVTSAPAHEVAPLADGGNGSEPAALAGGAGGAHLEVTGGGDGSGTVTPAGDGAGPGPAAAHPGGSDGAAPVASSGDGSGPGSVALRPGGGDGPGLAAGGSGAGRPDVVSNGAPGADGSVPAGGDGPAAPAAARAAAPGTTPAGPAADAAGSAPPAPPGDGSAGALPASDGSPVAPVPGGGDGAGTSASGDGSVSVPPAPVGGDGTAAGPDGTAPGADGPAAGNDGTAAGGDGATPGADGADPAAGVPRSAVAGRVAKALNDIQESRVARYVRLGPTDVGRAVTKVPFNVANGFVIKTPPSPHPAVPPVPAPPPPVPVPQFPPPPPPPPPGLPAPPPGTPAPPVPTPPVPPGHPVGGGTVTVQPGDTLWEIAKERLGNPLLWPLIEKANPEIGPNALIFPGQVLRIPEIPAPPAGSSIVVVQPGDSLWVIADGNEALVEEIAEINRLTDPSLIFVGQTLVVPPAT